MSAETATVEVLTAEVRVLMVGSRQITLSVARQLDEVALEDLEPFGRIRLEKDRDPFIIGKNRKTGALVVARYNSRPFRGVNVAGANDRSLAWICKGSPAYETHMPWCRFLYEDWSITIDKRNVEPCQVDHCRYDRDTMGYVKVPLCEPSLVITDFAPFRAAIEEGETCVQRNEKAARLPLIVLAGLR